MNPDPVILSEILFSSICNPKVCVLYKFETAKIKFNMVLNKVLKIQARYTFENKNRYFLALDRHVSDSKSQGDQENVFQLVEFTDLSNIVSYDIIDDLAYSKFVYGFPWFYHFTIQLKLPTYNKLHHLPMLQEPLITDQGYCIVKYGYMDYDVYLDSKFEKSISLNIAPDVSETIIRFGQYLQVRYYDRLSYHDLLSKDHANQILCYEFSRDDRLDIWSANEPFLFVENQTQNRINLINLKEKTVKTILPKFRSMDLKGGVIHIIHITQKGKHLVFENCFSNNYFSKYQYQQFILEFE
jgi:hypothetical protein